jgi:CHAD domain-containing protein
MADRSQVRTPGAAGDPETSPGDDAPPGLELPEAEIHRFHRRLRADLFRSRVVGGKRKRSAPLREVLRAIGEVRDADVSLRELHRWARNEPGIASGRALRSLSRRLEAEGQERRATVQSLLRTHRQVLRARRAGSETARLDPQTLRQAREKGLRRLLRAHLRALGRPSPRRLHRVRKRIRELGLLREWSETGRTLDRPRHGPTLHRLMQRLGRLNDRAILIQWLRRQAKDAGTRRILRSLERRNREGRSDLWKALRKVDGTDWKRWTRPAATE